MTDSDDENFVTFGNALEPLDEDNLPRKKPVTLEDQYALDDQGRRRFHGAFTGGFSAGYFNSVGTRDGWRPQQFKSSRSSKAGGFSQRPEDFMDDEDTSEFGIAPSAIRANSDFMDHSKRGTKRERQRHQDGPIPGVPVLQELLKPVKDTVGVTLLKKMGWRPGQGIGPRVTKREKIKTRERNEKIKIYGCSLPNQMRKPEDTDSDASEDNNEEILFAPDDYELFICNPKDNYFGIGYTGLDRRPVLSGHVNLFETPSSFNLQEKNKKLSIRGQAFGVGAFEADDEDIYQRDDMSRYDFSLGPEKKAGKSRWSGKHDAENSKENYLQDFVPATKRLERKKVFEPPELPKDFQPVHAVRKSRFYPPIEPPKGPARPDLSAIDRGRILGESPQNSRTDGESNAVPLKSNSVASNIITRTLNLHGKEQIEERRQQESQNKSANPSWMDKLNLKSFVSGGVENKNETTGSLKNLGDFKAEVSGTPKARPFISDPDKQARFEKFVELSRKGEKEKWEKEQLLSMTEWERQQETEEFEQAARIFVKPGQVEEISVDSSAPSCSKTNEKFVSEKIETISQPRTLEEQMRNAAKMKLFGKLTRQRDVWQPANTVCKRFNIPIPRSGCASEEKTKTKKFSVFENLTFDGFNVKFEGATDTAGTYKEPHIPYTPSGKCLNDETDSPRVLDVSDPESLSSKSTDKLRSFEASYEKVFGRGDISTTRNIANDNISTENTESNLPVEMETDITDIKNNSSEKKDLFKAIFLSSSEESSSDKEDEEDDSEAVKSLLIGKPGQSGIGQIEQMNLLRNTSPPRGIFADLDLDSLTKSDKPVNFLENKKSSNESNENPIKGQSERVEKNNSVENNNLVSGTESLPDMYGPALPERISRVGDTSSRDEASSSKDNESQKPIFKSVVVTKISDNGERSKGKWVERSKVKKSKKEKHKHKHKERDRSRQKHKSKKNKR